MLKNGALPHTVSIKLEFGLVDHSQSIKLIGQRTLPHHELGSVGPIQTVHTVGPQHAGLQQQRLVKPLQNVNVHYQTQTTRKDN